MTTARLDSEQVAEDTAAISEALLRARRTNTALSRFPGQLPKTLAAAYAVQQRSIGEWDDTVAGWKVGGVPPGFQDAYGATRLAGPIFSRTVKKAGSGERVQMPAFRKGFVAVEAEFVIELDDTSNLPVRCESTDDLMSAIRAIYMGVEIASSPMLLINDLGPGAIISDFGNNHGLILGPRLPDGAAAMLDQVQVTVEINEQQVGSTKAASGVAGPLGAVLFLVNHLRAAKQVIAPGTYVSTGAITGVHDASIGDTSVVKFDGVGTLNIELVDL